MAKASEVEIQTDQAQRNMNVRPIDQKSGLTPRPNDEMINSFANGHPGFFEVSGPGALARLVNWWGKRTDIRGLYWIDEEVLLRVRNAARSDLVRQLAQPKQPFAPWMDRDARKMHLQELVRLYMRHVLRFDTAICKDWTAEFHGYVRLTLQPTDKLIAMVGPIKRQPAISHPGPKPLDPARAAQHAEREARNAAIEAQGIWLEGMATQYVIDFRFAANAPLAARIQGPLDL